MFHPLVRDYKCILEYRDAASGVVVAWLGIEQNMLYLAIHAPRSSKVRSRNNSALPTTKLAKGHCLGTTLRVAPGTAAVDSTCGRF